MTKSDISTNKDFIINFRKYSYDKVNIVLNQKDKGLYTINKLSQFIFINSEEINCEINSYQGFCELDITIELTEEKTDKEIYFSLLLYDNNLIKEKGIYLPINTFMNGIIKNNEQYLLW